MASEELELVQDLIASLDMEAMSLAERRRAIDSTGGAPADGTVVTPVDADGVPAEWLVPPGADDRVLVYLHGGAYHAGSLASARGLASLIAAHARARVLNVSYRLAPEHPFPAAVD
ncbi:MAG TPA: alpha/beta hydrolase fold domain-containing protein, partial [Acidimicrobiales bacterium]|nr:alpha/beta hydrolase fold domain-containing protein [Acidimicrobiales bacterium]